MGNRRDKKTKRKHDSESVLEKDIQVAENKNRIDSSNSVCIGSYFCTCTGTT